jgi:hypothetical protein
MPRAERVPRKRGRPKKDPEDKVKVLAVKDRRPQVLALRVQGYTPEQIARRLNTFPSIVLADLKALMAAATQTDPSLEEARYLQDKQIDHLMTCLQVPLMGGDPRAVTAASRLLDRRAKLLGLDKGPKEDSAAVTVAATLSALQVAFSERPALGLDADT